MSKVQEQIAALTRHLYEQHQAEKRPTEVEELHINVLGGGVETLHVTRPRSVPLAPGVHPPMGPRFVPGALSVHRSVSTEAEALQAVKKMFEGKGEELVDDDTPSIDAPAEKKSYKRKLEP